MKSNKIQGGAEVLINFEDWEIDNESPFGSGASEKKWLINPITKEKGIFKFPKGINIGKPTGEYWAEKLASQLAEVLEIECAKVDIGIFQGKVGSMSYMILKEDEELIEGIQYITTAYKSYDEDKFIDYETGESYSINMIYNSIKETGLFNEFLKIPIFDALIGNSDRHHSNWGIIENKKSEVLKLSPLYDNGSSLCCLIKDEDALNFLRDKMRFNSLIFSKSKSMIRWSGNKRIRHFELVEEIRKKYFLETIEFVEKIKNNLNDKIIEDIIYQYDDSIISKNLKKLLFEFLKERRNRIINIYFEEREK